MKKKIVRILVVILFLWAFLEVNNSWLQTTDYEIESERIPGAFDGLKIVQVSDLHDAQFGDNQSRLAKKIKKLDPDFVFLTGDFIDSRRYDLQNSLDFVEQIIDFTEVFYVLGNHEVAVNEVGEITDALSSLGVHVLRNQAITIEKNNEKIAIAGVDDPLMRAQSLPEDVMVEMLDEALSTVPDETYTLLLSHRPEIFDVYVNDQVDLVFSGHAHGGQIRIPGIGGLIAPGQGLFPAYTAGKHEQGQTTMLVSRGLGNSLFPFRIFNLPELVVVTLRTSKE
ncbi:metallophosphoesterase [Bacillus niameyensis]|uniref:metallophosphoesterase n=1 Tax=Bacillus niameyensis TaxID=1522308 RepID=UPI0007810813|nr:metallophosphoesterase [Bacillus niameyensis]